MDADGVEGDLPGRPGGEELEGESAGLQTPHANRRSGDRLGHHGQLRYVTGCIALTFLATLLVREPSPHPLETTDADRANPTQLVRGVMDS
uniref:Uncharacterized protein n=1 Tax=Streptomyces sp. NBC_00180 TaxID=2903632 RepID=A0AAU1ICU2_9ACTN